MSGACRMNYRPQSVIRDPPTPPAPRGTTLPRRFSAPATLSRTGQTSSDSSAFAKDVSSARNGPQWHPPGKYHVILQITAQTLSSSYLDLFPRCSSYPRFAKAIATQHGHHPSDSLSVPGNSNRPEGRCDPFGSSSHPGFTKGSCMINAQSIKMG